MIISGISYFGDVKTKCSTLDYEDEGACVLMICEDNSDCPEVGHPCRGGAIPEGMCNVKTHEYQYPPHYYVHGKMCTKFLLKTSA